MKQAVFLIAGAAALAAFHVSAAPAFSQEATGRPPLMLAQQGPGQSGADQNEADEGARDPLTADDFVFLAGSTLLFEIETARVAASRGANPEVRAFAERIIADRDGLLRDLQAAAGPGKAPERLDDENRKIVDALAAEQGAQLDASFVGMMIDTHEESVDLYDELKETVNEPRLRAYVDAALPRINAFLKEAEALEQKLERPVGSNPR